MKKKHIKQIISCFQTFFQIINVIKKQNTLTQHILFYLQKHSFQNNFVAVFELSIMGMQSVGYSWDSSGIFFYQTWHLKSPTHIQIGP